MPTRRCRLASIMRVLVIAREFPPRSGGIGEVARLEAEGLSERNHECVVLTDSRHRLDRAYPTLISLPARGPDPLFHYHFALSVCKWIKRNGADFDAIHLHFPEATYVPLLAPKQELHRMWATVHTSWWGMWQRYYRRADFSHMSAREIPSKVALARIQSSLERRALRKVPRVAAVSEGVATELKQGYGLEDVAIIPNGTEPANREAAHPTWTTGLEPSERGVFVGALRGQKGLFRGIDALSQSSRRPSLLLIGTGRLRGRLEKRARRRACRVSFGGFVAKDTLVQVLGSSAFFFLPSFYEGQSVAALEACASRLPVLGFSGTGVEYSVSRANREWLVPNGDLPRFAAILDTFASDDRLRREIGTSNWSFATKYNAAKMVSEYESWLSDRSIASSHSG